MARARRPPKYLECPMLLLALDAPQRRWLGRLPPAERREFDALDVWDRARLLLPHRGDAKGGDPS